MLPSIKLLIIAFIISYIVCIINKIIFKIDLNFYKTTLISLSAAFGVIVFLYLIEILVAKL